MLKICIECFTVYGYISDGPPADVCCCGGGELVEYSEIAEDCLRSTMETKIKDVDINYPTVSC